MTWQCQEIASYVLEVRDMAPIRDYENSINLSKMHTAMGIKYAGERQMSSNFIIPF